MTLQISEQQISGVRRKTYLTLFYRLRAKVNGSPNHRRREFVKQDEQTRRVPADMNAPHANQPPFTLAQAQAIPYGVSPAYGPPYGQSSAGPLPNTYPATQVTSSTQSIPQAAAPVAAHAGQWVHPSQYRQHAQPNPAMLAQGRMHNAGPRVPPDPYGPPAVGFQTPVGARPPQPTTRMANPEQFVKNLAQFMHQRGQSLNLSPAVGGRVINLMHLYATVVRMGGFKKVNASEAWPTVAAAMQFPPTQYPLAPQELKDHYERNLALYEEAWIQSQQRQRAMNNMQHMQSGAINPLQQPHMSFTKPIDPRGQAHSPQPMLQGLQGQPPVQAPPPQMPIKQTFSPQTTMSHISANGHVTPEPHQSQSKQQPIYPQQTPSRTSHLLETPPPQGQQPAFLSTSPVPRINEESMTSRNSPHISQDVQVVPPKEPSPAQQNYSPRMRILETYGGLDIGTVGQIGAELAYHKPTIPNFMELGVIDIHALTMSLKSGLHAEVRLALDMLAMVSVDPRIQLSLSNCEDLLETLVDCAETQVELLAENAVEVSDVMDINPYEEVLRSANLEMKGLQGVPAFGTLEHELDRAVERLICITTILRNLSFHEPNHELLADSTVIKPISTFIRYMGTRNMLLRTSPNTLEFMKDTIIFLSNVSQAIELPGKEEALSLLHFLLAFAPCPPPTNPSTDTIMFSPYQPLLHNYLPPAVDSLAKLLARDEPNRSLYRAIFLNDYGSTPPYDLLTRTFALAISPVPDVGKPSLTQVVEARKPYLVQGMLAAEILANLAPGPETGVARSWLSSADGFAPSLLRLVCLLSADRGVAVPRNVPAARMRDQEIQSYSPITHRGIAVLRRLVEKSRSPDQPNLDLPVGLRLKKESLLGTLLTQSTDGYMVRELCAYASLDD